jgi:hypothetical protein
MTLPHKEKEWVWGFAAVVMLITWLPYLIGFYTQGSNWYFSGFLFGADDGNSYIAKMLTGTFGDWLFRTPYTAYPQRGAFLFFPYLLLGKLVAPPGLHEQMTALYGTFRIAAGLLVIIATYDFISVFLSEVRWRRLALVLAVLGGGFGWISIFGLSSIFAWNLPPESYLPEAFGFLSIYGLPHLALARALLLWGLRGFLVTPDWYRQKKGWASIGLIWAGIGLFQPIIQATGLLVIAFFLAASGAAQLVSQVAGREKNWGAWIRYLKSAIAVGLCAAPVTVYTFLAFRLDPTLRIWESQSPIASPPPLDYLLGYGVALPLALFGLYPLIKKQPWYSGLLAGWLLFAPIAAYAPFSSQRRLLDGFWVALSILAVYGVSILPARRQKLAQGWLALAFPMTLFLLTAGFMFALNPTKPLFRPAQEVEAFRYLAANAHTDDVVLAADESANPLPAWAPVHTLLGLGTESLNAPALRPRVACFYSMDCSDNDRQALLQEFNIRYVLWGPGERELGSWDPHASQQLKPVFASGDYVVFQTMPIQK